MTPFESEEMIGLHCTTVGGGINIQCKELCAEGVWIQLYPNIWLDQRNCQGCHWLHNVNVKSADLKLEDIIAASIVVVFY